MPPSRWTLTRSPFRGCRGTEFARSCRATVGPVSDERRTPTSDGDDRRRELGENDKPVEDEINESFTAVAEEGAERLHRTTRVVLTTGFAGGLEIGLGVMGYLAVLHATGDHLLAGLAFSVGLVALYLA